MLAAEWGTGQVFWSMVWFSLFVIWIWLLIAVFSDIFRSPDMSGWAKAIWAVIVIVTPYLGVFAYLIARGPKMGQHARDEALRREQMFGGYVPDAAPPRAATGSAEVDQLAKLAQLRASGVLDEAEYQQMKARVVTPTAAPTG